MSMQLLFPMMASNGETQDTLRHVPSLSSVCLVFITSAPYLSFRAVSVGLLCDPSLRRGDLFNQNETLLCNPGSSAAFRSNKSVGSVF
jgi:hypothetical protein